MGYTVGLAACAFAATLATPIPTYTDRQRIPQTPTEPLGAYCGFPGDGYPEDSLNGDCGSLVCRKGTCSYCKRDDECSADIPEQACVHMDSDAAGDDDDMGDDIRHRAICTHKRLIPPDWRDIAAIITALIVSAVAAGGGIGGGGLLLPLLILTLAMTPHDAAPLANATVLGGAIANLLLNVKKTHPSDATRSLINFEVALMMEPMTMAGALAGVLLNKVLPGWLITLMLILILGITTKRTLVRGLGDWHKEAAAAKITQAQPEAGASLLSSQQAPPSVATTRASGEGASKTVVHDVAFLVVALSMCTILSRLRGSNQFNSVLGVRCGSLEYFGLTLAQLALMLVLSLAIRSILLARHEQRVASKYEFLPDDVLWTSRSTVVYPTLCAVAGLCAGVFGIGGGIIKVALAQCSLITP